MKKLKRIGKISYLTLKRFWYEDYAYQASALAFTTLLSLVPAVAVIFYIFSFSTHFTSFIKLTENYIYANFLPKTGEILQVYLNKFINQTGQLPSFSIVFSIVTSIIMAMTIQDILNTIWRVRYKRKSFISALISWLVLLLMPLFMGLIIFLSTTISATLFSQYQYIILGLFNIVLNSLLLGLIYIVVPNHAINWLDGLMGGALAALLFEVGKKLFEFYIVFLTSYEFVYGALASIPIFLLWLYISWSIILLGALFISTKNEVH